MDFGLTVDDTQPGYTILNVAGEVDLATAPDLRTQLLELINLDKVNLIVNLEPVTFLDSTGLGVLVSAHNRARSEGGDLTLVCTRESLLKVFEITGLSTVFAIHDSLAAATRD